MVPVMREIHLRRPVDALTPGTPLALPAGTSTRVLIASAVLAVGVLVLLVPTTPVLGILLVAAILGGVTAALLRRPADQLEGATLADLEPHGYRILRDRVAPSLAGTISCLVIGPGGVFVIEVRDDRGRVRLRGDRLVIDGRSLALAQRLKGQAEAVDLAIGTRIVGSGVPVTPVVCVRRAELPLFRRDVAGLPLLREPQVVAAILRAPRVIDAATAETLADLAAAVMPAAGRATATRPSETVGSARIGVPQVTARSVGVVRGSAEAATEAALPA